MPSLPPRFADLISKPLSALRRKVRKDPEPPPRRVIKMYPLSTYFSDLKQEIANSYPDFEKRITTAWGEIIDQLNETTEAIAKEGSEVRRLWPNQILASTDIAC